eukprot:gene7351-11673_t
MKIVILVLAVILVVAQAKLEWSLCPENRDVQTLKIKTLTATPTPPRVGEKIKVDLAGTLTSPIVSGIGAVVVNFEGFELFKDDNIDICNFGGALKCPVSIGELLSSYENEIPSVAPVGEYDGKIQLKDQAGKVIACIDFKTDIEA